MRFSKPIFIHPQKQEAFEDNDPTNSFEAFKEEIIQADVAAVSIHKTN